MSELKIVGWTDFESDYPTKELNEQNTDAVVGLLVQAIPDGGYRFSGGDHQCAATGVPVFSDGTAFRASMRCWGMIMAMAWSKTSPVELSYMDFYASVDGERVLPEAAEIPVAPAALEGKDHPGCAIQADAQVLQESAAMGMPLMTTDKVLQRIMRQIQEGNT
jgi:hypothetical protein